MKRPPVPRERIFSLYWHFASERQHAFERRVSGLPAPWTTDPIIRTYKFCNVFRAADRVSQYLIRQVAYHDEPCSVADRLFQIVAFRVFSNIDTWDSIRAFLGRQPTIRDLKTGMFAEALEEGRRNNGRLYTGAFILCATNAYGQKSKHENHVELFKHLFAQDRVAQRLEKAKSLRGVYEILHEYPLLGDFMSYQIAIDLNYSSLLGFGENDFTQPGPGALRGIRKVFEDLGDYSPAEAILWMVDHQDEEFRKRNLAFSGLWGRPLHAIDCQGLFCETDKYCREAAPELTSARRRIKARFSASTQPITLFFPPKWNINHLLPAKSVFGESIDLEPARQLF